MTANERANQLLRTPHSRVPLIAEDFLRYVSNKSALTREIIVDAFCVYAAVVEGCDSDERPMENHLAWFRSRGIEC